MKAFNNLSNFILVLIVIISCIQCTSIPKLEKESPTTFKEAYYQKWNTGIEEGMSNTHNHNLALLYISISIGCNQTHYKRHNLPY